MPRPRMIVRCHRSQAAHPITHGSRWVPYFIRFLKGAPNWWLVKDYWSWHVWRPALLREQEMLIWRHEWTASLLAWHVIKATVAMMDLLPWSGAPFDESTLKYWYSQRAWHCIHWWRTGVCVAQLHASIHRHQPSLMRCAGSVVVSTL